MTEAQISEHNRAFEEAAAIVQNEIALHERPDMPAPGWWLRRRLRRALSLFARVLELNPENWSAMWLMGKVHQRFRELPTALSWFERAYQINPSQPDVAREASRCAMEVGSHDAAIAFAHRAVQIEPTNPGLHANLALACVLAGRISDAQSAIVRASTDDPGDTISQTIRAIIRHFAANGRTPPSTTPELRRSGPGIATLNLGPRIWDRSRRPPSHRQAFCPVRLRPRMEDTEP
jgi:tetratricopeptide (TPR) repeat protein